MRAGMGELLPDSAVGAYIPDNKVASMKEGGRYIFVVSFFLTSSFFSTRWEMNSISP